MFRSANKSNYDGNSDTHLSQTILLVSFLLNSMPKAMMVLMKFCSSLLDHFFCCCSFFCFSRSLMMFSMCFRFSFLFSSAMALASSFWNSRW